MRILFLMCSYNELHLLKWKHEYCIKNNLEMFIVDNMSTDGTVEYLQDHYIPFCQVDTNEVFDLRPLLEQMNVQLHRLKPDWFIYHGMDVFPAFRTSIQENIEICESSNIKQIALPQYSIHNTGEKYNGENPFSVYFWYHLRFKMLALICKYNEKVLIVPDKIFIPNQNSIVCDGVFFELHAFNTPAKRLELLKRRQKAWDNGMPRNWGTHYVEEKDKGFKNPGDIQDIRNNKPLYELYKKLI